jgi:uncharacterized protein YhaN
MDGYGRFTGRELEFSTGLQIVVGPNEQGKTTVRNFIGDMLYGQKTSTTQRRYAPNHELRRPWQDPGTYAGRMLYELDDGRTMEVRREFDRKRELVQVFDRTHGEDITGQFKRLANREPAFAEEHLGLTKAVFLNAATIGHINLEDLGDEDALAQIREHILGLTDSADEGRSAEAALQYLERRVASIGRPSAQSKRPLPAARARLEALEKEYAQTLLLRDELAALQARRVEIGEELQALRMRQETASKEELILERAERVRRLHEAEELEEQIQKATQRCFELSEVRDFPLERGPEVQRAANALATARVQLERTRNEQDEVAGQGEEERERVGDAVGMPTEDIPEEWDERLATGENEIRQVRERFEELEGQRAAAASRLATAEEEMGTLPDFSGVPANPVEWLSQKATSFQVARETKERERKALERVAAQVTRRESEVAAQEVYFSGFEDFPRAAREYEVVTRLFQEQQNELRTRIEESQRAIGEHSDEAASFRGLTLFFAAAIAVVAAGLVYSGMTGLWVAAAGLGIVTSIFLWMWLHARRAVRRSEKTVEENQAKLAEWEVRQRERPEATETAIRKAGCGTLRELEALYDRYCGNVTDLYQLRHELEIQGKRTAAEEESITRQFGELRELFGKLGVELSREEDVQDAAAQAIALYQEWRDAKRRMLENRDQHEQLRGRCEQIRTQLAELEKAEREASLEARRLMRKAGYLEERLHTSARKALQSFRIRMAQTRQKRGRLEVLTERAETLSERLEAEQRDLERCEAALAKLLRGSGAETVDEWQALAAKARTYRETWAQRTSLMQQSEAVLQGDTIEALRQRVAADKSSEAGTSEDGPSVGVATARSLEQLREEKEQLGASCDRLAQEEHELHVEIARQEAGARSVNEVEEERALVRGRLEALEREMDATTHAATVVEEVARDKHARIAPRLASMAGEYLREITGGAYGELLVSRDLDISVRIPQTQRLNSEPEQVLSTGTVDQIYLALRLALVECLGESGESIPMLLDDPFANYDNDRLMSALSLTSRLSEKTQFILFTCREDVAEGGEAIGAPILRL